MEDNKKNAKILSDEELENVAGGATYKPTMKSGEYSHIYCAAIKNEKSCKHYEDDDKTRDLLGHRNGGCAWRDGKCVASRINY
jgi:hypothetical protein